MHYVLSFLIFLFSFVTHAQTCSKDDLIEGEFIVLMQPNKASLKSLAYKKMQIEMISNHSRSILSLSKTAGSEKSTKMDTMLISNSNLAEVKKAFPAAKVQQNCRVKSFQTAPSEDTFYNFQRWFHNSLNVNYSPLSPLKDVVVAVSDTGVDINHIDIHNNLWRNEAEFNGSPGVDDDGNGFVDDIHGYDLGDNDSNPVPTVRDSAIDFDHGTHVAGLIGASTFNSQGVAGISLNAVKIMALKGFKSNSGSTIADLLKTIYYAVDNGANIINASWGSEKAAEAAEIEAINYATSRGVVVVAAAGNSSVPAAWFTPASIGNVVTVGALNSDDELSTFSNYGDKIDFLAPGGDGGSRLNESLLSLGISSDYIELRGTSMSAPLVSGAIGLIMALNPELTAFQAVKALEITGRKLRLKPYLQQNNLRDYVKPDVAAAINYLNSGNTIPDVKPDLDTVGSFESRDLASNGSDGGGGCSNSLSSQSFNEGDNSSSKMPLGIVFFFLFPLIFTTLYKKKVLI